MEFIPAAVARRGVRGSRLRSGLLAAVVAIPLALEGSLLLLNGAESGRRADALAVARRVAVDMTSRNPGQGPSPHDLTGNLRRQIGAQQELLKSVLAKSSARSKSSVVLAGIESCEKSTCRALLAVNAHVRNADTPKGETRRYRMRLTLVHTGGDWKVRGMELVP